ncbi:MAG: exodeoxyribonuclease VII large subunit, partial [bacterium]|nr:exodeoxyribonuclease VII large subunit [bacterium]
NRLALCNPKAIIEIRQQTVSQLKARHTQAIKASLAGYRSSFAKGAIRLQGLSPVHILRRGYSICEDNEGHLVTHANQISPGGEMITTLAKGRIVSKVLRGELDREI